METPVLPRLGVGAWLAPRRACLVAAAVAALAYAGTLTYGFVWDDPHLLRAVRGLLAEGGVGRLVTSEFVVTDPTGYYRPLVYLSLWADDALAGVFPMAFHLTNVLVHAGATGLVCLVLAELALSPAAAFAGSLLFALHPVHTESVAFVAGRTDLLAAFFALLAALLWLRGRRTPGRLAVVGSGAALLLGLLSKEVTLPLPALLLAADLFWKGPSGFGRRNRPWLAAWGLALGVFLTLRLWVAGVGWGAPSGEVGPSLVALWATYARLLVAPWPLNAVYGKQGLPLGLREAAAAAVLFGLADLGSRPENRRLGWVGLAWIAAFLVPVSGAVQLHAAPLAERFLYLPSFGLSVLAAAALDRFAGGARRRAAVGLTVAVCATFLAATLARLPVWRDDLTLARSAVETSGGAPLAHFNYGCALVNEGRYDEAVAAFQRGLVGTPRDAEVYNNLGNALAELGRVPEAMAAFGKACELAPGRFEAYFNQGRLFLGQGNLEAAALCFRQAATRSPTDPEPFFRAGSAYGRLGLFAEAARHFEAGLALGPAPPGTLNDLGIVYAALGRPREAAAALRQALEWDPDHVDAHYNLGLVLAGMGDPAGAAGEVSALEALAPSRARDLRGAIRGRTAGKEGTP